MKFILPIFALLIMIYGCSNMNPTFDNYGIRYTYVKKNPGPELNWVFIPGGPGADSRYLRTLIDLLDVPGNLWLVDLPGSGDNPAPEGYDFHQWLQLMPSVVSRFPNCIIVGHSLGGMLPLLSPEIEGKLSGLVLINSSPSLWTDESARLFKEHGIPDLPEKQAFFKDKTQDNYNKLLQAYLPYYFNKDAVSKGREMFKDLPFPVNTMLNVFGIMQEINYNARWIPQRVPTLVIGGDQDYINPYSLYEKDKRFSRSNIQKVLLKGCGHWCWIEKPDEVSKLLSEFSHKLFASKLT